jgi:hypothetical protein
VNKGCTCAVVMAVAILAWTAQPVSADPIQATFAVTVNPLYGHHEVDGGQRDTISFAPLPLGELTLRHRDDSLRIEGLPPVAFTYGGSGDGAQSTQLSLINATYRRSFAGGWFIGAGVTLYNQFTDYGVANGNFVYTRDSQVVPIDGSEAQYSRVSGARFEAGRMVQHGRDRLEFWAAVNPRMRGIQYTRIPTSSFVCQPFGGAPPCVNPTHTLTFADPENAAQVDLSARIAHRVSKYGELLYGFRYLNYSAHYDDFPGQIADRNVGFAPTIGFRLRL